MFCGSGCTISVTDFVNPSSCELTVGVVAVKLQICRKIKRMVISMCLLSPGLLFLVSGSCALDARNGSQVGLSPC